MSMAVAARREGIGLLSHRVFIESHTLPTEDEQYETYRKWRSASDPPLIIRTFDLAATIGPRDCGYQRRVEPFLGWRAIRFFASRTSISSKRSARYSFAPARLACKNMFPMISGVDELRAAISVLPMQEELCASKMSIGKQNGSWRDDRNPECRHFRRRARARSRFFQYRTNDLIQYALESIA